MSPPRIQQDERGLLFKHGNYVKRLGPGVHYLALMHGYELMVMNLDKPFEPGKNLNLFLTDKELLKELDVVDVSDHELVLHYEDGHFLDVLGPGKHAFWNVLKKHEFITIDAGNPQIDEKIDPSILNSLTAYGSALAHEIADHEIGLLFYNNVFQKTLEPGKYYFWKGPRAVTTQRADMRRLQLDMTGQEIMTEDKVTLRMNFVCHYKITDPVLAVSRIKNLEEQLYILLQLMLREYVGTLKLDDLLLKKQEIGEFVLAKLSEKSTEFGVAFIFAGVKDIILPGEIKEILNLVLTAEKKALANTITRREETASTRSLLNTAKLMDDNPTLYKLKELEYLERICEKIGNISLMSGGNLLEHLTSVLGTGAPAKKT